MNYLGIDFGTSYTKAAAYSTEDDNPVLIELSPEQHDFGFEKSLYFMPTAVSANKYGKDFIVGVKAINLKLDSDRVFFENFKPELDHEEEYAMKSPDITYMGLVAEILKEVKKNAEKIKDHFDRIVITVPASTVRGGRRWNLMMRAAQNVFDTNNIDLIFEPEAAGFALLNKQIKDSSMDGKYFLIYDFGGGTFDATVFTVEDEQIFVIGESVGSDDEKRWGGMYLDNLIRQEYLKNGYTIREKVSKLRSSELSLSEKGEIDEILRVEPVKAKIKLSNSPQFQFSLLDYTITRKDFEGLADPMIEETIGCCTKLLNSKVEDGIDISFEDLETVFLVGGSSKIPLISKKWKEKTSTKMQMSNMEVVAEGAALYHSIKINLERMVELGMKRLSNKQYDKAALYFRNSESQKGYYLLGLLYFNGKLSNKPAYKKAITCFERSQTPEATLMLAIMSFSGLGMKKNDKKANDFLDKSCNNNVSELLRRAIKGEHVNYCEIYGYNPLVEFDREMKDIDEHVEPCNPELKYTDIISLI